MSSHGKISRKEFVEYANAFHELSVLIGDHWEWIGPKENKYIKKRSVITINAESLNTPDVEDIEEESAIDICMMRYKDDCAEAVVPSHTIYNIDYHVVYSDSYCVPVLYFNAFHSNGQMLKHEELVKLFSPAHREVMVSQIWTTVTQTEHPILQLPFYMLHPCKTASLMNNVKPVHSVNNDHYLLQWLSSVGSAVALDISLCYTQILSGNSTN